MTNQTQAFARRRIALTIQLGTGSYGESGFNQLRLEGLRVAVQIEQGALPSPPSAVIRAYGLTRSNLNEITKSSLNWKERANSVMVEAGDEGGVLTTVFNGVFFKAAPDFSDMPSVPLVIVANAGFGVQMKPVAAQSFTGAVPVETALNKIAGPAGFSVENNGVNPGVLRSPYFAGTVMDQVNACVDAAGCIGAMDTIANVIRIWPKNGTVSSNGGIPLISAASGMIGYPAFDYNTITIRSLFNPQLKAVGGKIQVQSDFEAANGLWIVSQIDYNLAAELPGGPWEMVITAYRDASQAN